MYRRSLALTEANFGKTHPVCSRSLVDLATLLHWQVREYGCGSESHEVSAVMVRWIPRDLNGNCDCALLQGRFMEAEPMYRRALAIAETTLGTDHLRCFGLLEGLARTVVWQVRRQAYLRTVVGLPGGVAVAPSLTNGRGPLSVSQDRLDEAETLYRRAVVIVEANPGKIHSLYSFTSLAGVLSDKVRVASLGS